MDSALSTITVFPSNKLEIAQYGRRIKSEILADDRDPLKILKQLKYVEKVIKELLTDHELDNHFLEEGYKYEGESFEHLDCKFSIKETGVKYDYDACGDPVWNDLTAEMNELKDKIKTREKMLQNAGEGFVDQNSGVFVTAPPKSSKTKLTVIL